MKKWWNGKNDTTNHKVLDTIKYDSDWAPTVAQKIIFASACIFAVFFFCFFFKQLSSFSTNGWNGEMDFSFFNLKRSKSRISSGLNGYYQCKPLHCSGKLWLGGNYQVARKIHSFGHDGHELSPHVWWFDSFGKYSSIYLKHDPLLLSTFFRQR